MPKNPPKMALSIAPLTSGLDQPYTIPGLAQTLTSVESVVDYSIAEKNPSAALSMVGELVKINRLSALATSKALWYLGKRWRELGLNETFEDSVFEKVGLAPETTRRYVQVWEMFESFDSVDKDTKNSLYARPIGDLIAMAQAQAAHGKFTKAQLKKLADSTDNKTLRDNISKILGRETNKGPRVQFHERRDGNLEYQKNGRRVIIGHLRAGPEDLEDPMRSEGIALLRQELGLLKE